MSEQGGRPRLTDSGGVLAIRAAEGVPGLWDAQLVGFGAPRAFRDITNGQVRSIATASGARIEVLAEVPQHGRREPS